MNDVEYLSIYFLPSVFLSIQIFFQFLLGFVCFDDFENSLYIWIQVYNYHILMPDSDVSVFPLNNVQTHQVVYNEYFRCLYFNLTSKKWLKTKM